MLNGYNLKRIRKQNKISGYALAKYLGISKQYIYQVENGYKKCVTQEKFKQLIDTVYKMANERDKK